MRPMKTAEITNKTMQHMKIAPAPTQTMKTSPYIPKILHKIINKRRWIITLQARNQEWEPLKKKIIDAIESDIATSDTYTTVYTESIVVDVNNTGVRVGGTGVAIDNPGVQDISHE